MRNITFYEDLPFPETNIDIYRDIYYAEQWLRRILLAALYANYGEKWIESVPSEILNELKKRRGSLRGRTFLDCENNSNVIWLSTFDELNKLFIGQELWPTIKYFTKFARAEFTEKVQFLREIRNIIGHNRATTEQTLNICHSLVNFFREGIDNFRIKIFKNEEEFEQDLELRDGVEFSTLNMQLYDQVNPEGSQIFLWESVYFREIFTLPVPTRQHSLVDIAEICDAFKELEPSVLAICINMSGDEYGIIWPKCMPVEYQSKIISKFLSSEPCVWTSKDYQSQTPKYLCDPKIWFYGDEILGQNEQPYRDELQVKSDQPQGTNLIHFPPLKNG
jgi:hypothetical protein